MQYANVKMRAGAIIFGYSIIYVMWPTGNPAVPTKPVLNLVTAYTFTCLHVMKLGIYRDLHIKELSASSRNKGKLKYNRVLGVGVWTSKTLAQCIGFLFIYSPRADSPSKLLIIP